MPPPKIGKVPFGASLPRLRRLFSKLPGLATLPIASRSSFVKSRRRFLFLARRKPSCRNSVRIAFSLPETLNCPARKPAASHMESTISERRYLRFSSRAFLSEAMAFAESPDTIALGFAGSASTKSSSLSTIPE